MRLLAGRIQKKVGLETRDRRLISPGPFRRAAAHVRDWAGLFVASCPQHPCPTLLYLVNPSLQDSHRHDHPFFIRTSPGFKPTARSSRLVRTFPCQTRSRAAVDLPSCFTWNAYSHSLSPALDVNGQIETDQSGLDWMLSMVNLPTH